MGVVEGIAASARRLAAGVGVEVAAVVPLRGGRAGAPMLVATGGLDAVQIRPPDVFRALLRLRAEAAVLLHVHLRDVGPSREDLAVTRRLVAAGLLLGVPLRAHLVIEPGGWFDCCTETGLRRSYSSDGSLTR
jgi:DNA repair protein RadC